MELKESSTGFEYGPVKVTRLCSDDKKGWVVLAIQTAKHPFGKEIQVYVTKTGKVRFWQGNVELKAPASKPRARNKPKRL